MRILFPIFAFILATIGAICTLDWEDKAAEMVRWCIGTMFVLLLIMFLSGCSTGKALIDACRDGLCR